MKEKLSAVFVQKIRQPGTYADGGNLYLRVEKNAKSGVINRRWFFRYKLSHMQHGRWMGLGSVKDVGLAEARVLADQNRKMLIQGMDPLEEKYRLLEEADRARARNKTFREVFLMYFKAHEKGWSNKKYRDVVRDTMTNKALPIIGDMPVMEVDQRAVVEVLSPIWETVHDTAEKLRGKIEAVLDYAKAHGWRQGENPARWRGHLDMILAKPSAVRIVKHHPALPIDDVPAFIKRLVSLELNSGPRALLFAILNASRTGEVIGSTFSEIDFKDQTWIIPAHRMKARREHRIPLSSAAMRIISEMREISINQFIFPGDNPGEHLSNVSLLRVLKRMGVDGITTHGFRSTFRDWAAERTNYPREVCEAALAHVLKNRSEAAYFRSDLMEKRRALMNDWANFCFSCVSV